MENQVKCSSGNMTTVILAFTWWKSRFDSKKTREAPAEGLYNYTKRPLLDKNSKLSDDRKHGVDCVRQV